MQMNTAQRHSQDFVSANVSSAARSLIPGIAAIVLGFVIMLGAPAMASAARVTGTLVSAQGQPEADFDLHFDNRITRDVFLLSTGKKGGFEASLPPGSYDLRTRQGYIIRDEIMVGRENVSLGRVTAPNQDLFYTMTHFLELQRIAPSLLTSPAPSSARVMTLDTTVVPPSAKLIIGPPKLPAMQMGSEMEQPSAMPTPLPGLGAGQPNLTEPSMGSGMMPLGKSPQNQNPLPPMAPYPAK